MCGRFTRASPPAVLAATFEVTFDDALDLRPRWNVCPGEDVLAVVAAGAGRKAGLLRWGLVPWFARDARAGARGINARVETAAERPTFRDPFRHRRCLVVADGFYEWRGVGAARVPYFVRQRSGAPFGFAGLWDRWAPPKGPPLVSCAILTRPATGDLAAIHDRMPVIVPPAAFATWLDPTVHDPVRVRAVLAAVATPALEHWEVSRLMNAPRHDSPACAAPV